MDQRQLFPGHGDQQSTVVESPVLPFSSFGSTSMELWLIVPPSRPLRIEAFSSDPRALPEPKPEAEIKFELPEHFFTCCC